MEPVPDTSRGGFPVTVLGVVAPSGHFGVTALCLSSSVTVQHTSELFGGYKASTERVTGKRCKYLHSMSDAEEAYRRPLQETFGSQSLMCYFHVTAAAKKYVWKHATGDKAAKKILWSVVKQDLDVLHNAQNQADFSSRWEAVSQKWVAAGVDAQTEWVNKKGEHWNFISHCKAQWVLARPEWYWGTFANRCAPTTNNQCERYVRTLRDDSGRIVASLAATIQFIMDTVGFESGSPFDPTAPREPTAKQWRKAELFSRLFGTARVQEVPSNGRLLYACLGRTDADDVASRPLMSHAAATKAARTMDTLLQGGAVSPQELTEYCDARVFYIAEGRPTCSCLAFMPTQFCHHALGCELYRGMRQVPICHDEAVVERQQQGRKRVAPGRGSVPMCEDDKDREIKRLRRMLVASGDVPSRRIRGKRKL